MAIPKLKEMHHTELEYIKRIAGEIIKSSVVINGTSDVDINKETIKYTLELLHFIDRFSVASFEERRKLKS